MTSKVSETATSKARAKLSKSEENILVHHVITAAKQHANRQKMIATAAYYRAEKRGFNGNEADAIQDWLEAEMEVDNELGMFDSHGIDFQFLTHKTE